VAFARAFDGQVDGDPKGGFNSRPRRPFFPRLPVENSAQCDKTDYFIQNRLLHSRTQAGFAVSLFARLDPQLGGAVREPAFAVVDRQRLIQVGSSDDD
jgi:hypothetical protein